MSEDQSVERFQNKMEDFSREIENKQDEYAKFKKSIITTFLGDFVTGGLLISGLIFIIDYFNPEGITKLIIGLFLILGGIIIWAFLFVIRYEKKRRFMKRAESVLSRISQRVNEELEEQRLEELEKLEREDT